MLKMEFLFYLTPMFHSLLPCRVRHEQLFLTVKVGSAMIDPLPGASSKQLNNRAMIDPLPGASSKQLNNRGVYFQELG